jgi:uncharacterized protein
MQGDHVASARDSGIAGEPSRYEKQYEQARQAVTAISQLKPVAYSINGLNFTYEAPLSLSLPIGSYVEIVAANTRYLGQITSQEVHVRTGPEYEIKLDTRKDAGKVRWWILEASESPAPSSQVLDRVMVSFLSGEGILLGRLDGEPIKRIYSVSEKDTFQSGAIEKATDQAVTQYLVSTTARQSTLDIGASIYGGHQARIVLRAAGFKRHTFLCGQSGSGKTFALGVILERLLLKTELRIVIIDPNSDFVSLGQLRSLGAINRTLSVGLTTKEYDAISMSYAELRKTLTVLRPPVSVHKGAKQLKLWFSDLERHEQGLLLGIEPIGDREEFHAFWSIIDRLGKPQYSLHDVLASIAADFSPEARRVGLRIANLGIANWDIWCNDGPGSLVESLSSDARCVVIDVGALTLPQQRSAIMMATFGRLWRNRDTRRVTLIVIDEAHNICPAKPLSDLDVISAEHVVRIAGEGRKFGLYLLLASQRPDKLQANVLSECENLILMRMNSATDLETISRLFSRVPNGLLTRASGFTQGRALISGEIIASPALAAFQGRLTKEGGGDVPTDWVRRTS